MERKPRVHYPAAFYHVILRGNGGQEICFGQEDRIRFYLLLQEGIERYGHQVHAFCLMTNHVHLAMQVGEVSLPRIIQNLAFRYTRWVHWRRKRTEGFLKMGEKVGTGENMARDLRSIRGFWEIWSLLTKFLGRGRRD